MEKFKDFLKETWNKISNWFKKLNGTEEDGELFVERTKPRSFALAVFFNTLKILGVLVVLVGATGFGLIMGIAKAYVDTTPDLDVSLLTKSEKTSYIYDINGAVITTFSGMEYRDWADIEDIPDMLKNAVIAIEDVRFYKHSGVDYKRLFSAVVNTLRNADTHGGSTLTQQLIKNKILSNEQSYKRKIQEAYLALEVETEIEKDQILEAYLNDVYLGGSNYGMKAAAKDYFGKELSALTVRECAMLAAMVQRPQYYNPRLNTYSRFNEDGTNKMSVTDGRTDLVIDRMYKAGFITKDQHNNALNEKVTILEKSTYRSIYDMPYFVEYAIRDIVLHIIEQRGLLDTTANRTAVENELRTGGYHIYLTVDPKIQNAVQNTLANWDNYPKLKDSSAYSITQTNSDGSTTVTVQPQAAAVVFDYHTGELRAVVGGRTSPTARKTLNRAYQSSTPVGSSIKPLAVYGPALELGMSPASVLLNFPSPIEGWDTSKGYPAIGSEEHIGPLLLREGVVQSLNVAAARTLLEGVTIPTAAEYLAKLGVDPARISATGSGLALGTTGITPVEMAAAFGAIAAGGEYKEPLSFVKVVDDNGVVIIDANTVRTTRRVFKTSTAYMLVDILTDAVERGTGTRAQLSGITVAGKTGTNADYSSAYFCGMTPYYTASVWVGHDDFSKKLVSGSTGGRVAAPIFKEFMSQIHEGLNNKPIIDASPSELGLVKRTVCSVSGLLATDACKYDPNGYTPVTDWFTKDTAPDEFCDMHATVNICSISNEIATIYCPTQSVTASSVILIDSESPYSKLEPELLLQYLPNSIYSELTPDEFGVLEDPGASLPSDPDHTGSNVVTCHVHSYENFGQEYTEALAEANNLVIEVRTYLNNVQGLPDTERAVLENGVASLVEYISMASYADIVSSTSALKYNYTVISLLYPPVG
ncbi:MAG: transglycosylase domain-containing protein [Clostridia bacterium]|nr:transglycosylase domain-containing protein [Clostridia bacterium]